MPYFGHLLRGSELNASVSDAGFRAAHNLWWAAWNEVPAASLPDDDRRLARMADFGANLGGFLAVKDEALHGFIKCSDGRLYHQFLAGVAIQQWEQLGIEVRAKARARDRMRRLREQRADVLENETSPSGLPLGRKKERKTGARGRAREGFAKMNGEAERAAINPKILNHFDDCTCRNCTQWAKEHGVTHS